MNIEGSGALVAGGASGLGEATVRRLHDAGAVVTIADWNDEKGQALADELGIGFVKTDVRDESQVQAAVDAAAEADGGLRITVCCAGVGVAVKIASSKGPHPLELWDNVIGVNLTGTFNVWRLAAAAMLGNEPDAGLERGVLLGTASVAAFEGQVGQVAYSASKGGIVGMTLVVARDLAQNGIRANTIAPGLFDTPLLAALPEDAKASLGQQVPFPSRLGSPAEYAQLAQSIIENPMLNGATIRLDGAIRMTPR
ncbi:MAG TPA: SDR family NAD(P)-dependent oxidoreductase [Solirubrobacteraceae bacterium]